MSVEEKKNLLKKGTEFNRDNADRIRFDPNIAVTVILPADWHKNFKQETSSKTDEHGDEKQWVTSTFMVTNPNSADPKQLRAIRASEALYNEINTVIEQALAKDYDGDIIMTIKRSVTGGNPFGKWSVQANEYKEGQTIE